MYFRSVSALGMVNRTADKRRIPVAGVSGISFLNNE